jgi:iron complex outermembrane receptor protein
MTTGGFTGRATFNHRQGYDLNPAIGVTGSRYPAQYHVDSFDTVDLFFAYDVKGQGLFQNLSFTLNVSNLLDQDPPFYNEPMPIFTAAGFTNGSTYGRFIQFGVRKKF